MSTVRPEATIASVAEKLRRERIGALVVSRDGDQIDGIISERDIVYGIATHGAKALTMDVASLMTSAVATCGPEDTIQRLMVEMTRRRIRHFPVVEAGKLCGIVSIGDIVKHRLDELELEANVLRDAYIVRG